MTPTQKYEQFMRAIAASMTDNDQAKFKEVLISDGDGIDQFLLDSITKEVYPALCFSKPPYKNFDNGSYGYYSNFEVVMYVICKTSINDYGTTDVLSLIDADLLKAEQLANEFGAKLHQYNRLDDTAIPIDFSWNDWSAEPVTLLGSDAARGYEVKFRIGLSMAECLNPA